MMQPQPKQRAQLSLIVVRTETITTHLTRVVFGGPTVAQFTDNEFTDHYVKLQFAPPGVRYPAPFDLDSIRANLEREQWPVVRTYTVRSFDPATGELAIDFVVHGDSGVAGPWAAAARPGDELALIGPGGAYAPDPEADWHLLVGDESAVPAISNALEQLPVGAPAHVVIEVGTDDDEVKFQSAADVDITWLHRGAAMPGSTDLLIDHVRGMTFGRGVPHVFAHGEGRVIMKKLRPHLFGERELPRDQVSISGYWRQGRTEEEFREWKARLKAADEAEAAQS